MKPTLCIIGVLLMGGGLSTADLPAVLMGLLLMLPACSKSKASGKPAAKKARKKGGGLLGELFYDDPWGYKEFPYEYNGKRFRTRAEMERYRDINIAAACHSDPRYR